MIKLDFKNNFGRMQFYRSMQLVSEDVITSLKALNKELGVDRELPCPESNKRDAYGVVSPSELWFGVYKKPYHTLDIGICGRTLKDTFDCEDDKWLNMLFKMTILSLMEQFPKTKFTTNENWDEAITLWESLFGSIVERVADILNLPVRI